MLAVQSNELPANPVELRQGNPVRWQSNRDIANQDRSAFIRMLFLPAQDLVNHLVGYFVKFIQVIWFRGRFLYVELRKAWRPADGVHILLLWPDWVSLSSVFPPNLPGPPRYHQRVASHRHTVQ